MRRCSAFSPGVGSGRGGRRCQVSPRGSGCPAASLVLCVPSSSHCRCQQVPPSARSFACEHKTPGLPSIPGCLETWGVRAGSTQTPHLVGVTLCVAGAPRLCRQCSCVCVCLHGSGSGHCSSLCPFPGFMPFVPGATAKTLQTPWAESKASPSQPGIQGPAVWSCAAGPSGAGGITEPLPCSHCPASLDAGAGRYGGRGCQQGRSTQRSLQAFASPNLSEEWAAAALDGTCPFVM